MKFIIKRENLLKPLKNIIGLLENNPSLPILNNFLIEVKKNYLLITGSNMEAEIIVKIILNFEYEQGFTTINARKFYDICRNLPENSEIFIILKNDKILIKSGKSQYFLFTLPAINFPSFDDCKIKSEFTFSQSILKELIESTKFSMANKDSRYYLNGMLFEIKKNIIKTVSTDGYRLSICTLSIDTLNDINFSIIIPRKSIIELIHILNNNKKLITFQIGETNIRVIFDNYVFTSKLIDGVFPNYNNILLKNKNKMFLVNRILLKQACIRISVLSNEKFKTIKFFLNSNKLKITSKNLEHEEAKEIIDIYYQGIEIEIGLNVNYILDVLNSLKCEEINIFFIDEKSRIQIEEKNNNKVSYIIMPVRI